jgi:hypothetical protein
MTLLVTLDRRSRVAALSAAPGAAGTVLVCPAGSALAAATAAAFLPVALWATRLDLDTGDTMALPGRGSSMPMPGMIGVSRPCQGSPVWGATGCGECCGVTARTEAWLPAPTVLALFPLRDLAHCFLILSTAGRCAAARPPLLGETASLHPRGIVSALRCLGGLWGACPP